MRFAIKHYEVLKDLTIFSKKQLQELASDQFITGMVIQRILARSERAALSAFVEAYLMSKMGEVKKGNLRTMYYEGIISWFSNYKAGEIEQYRLKESQFSGIELAHALHVVGERVNKGSKELGLYFSTSPVTITQALTAEISANEKELLPQKTLPHTIYVQLVNFNLIARTKKKTIWLFSLRAIQKCFSMPLRTFSEN